MKRNGPAAAVILLFGVLLFCFVACSLDSSADGDGSGDDGSGNGGPDGGDDSSSYPPQSATCDALFEDFDAEIVTWRDAAAPVMPSLLEDSDEPALDELKEVFASFQPDAVAPQARYSSVFPAAKPQPECYSTGTADICVFQWQENGTHITVTDSRTQVLDQWVVYYKGPAGKLLFPGDLTDPDDYGYLLQNHTSDVDWKWTSRELMFEPGIGCNELPCWRWRTEVSDEITVKTPWGTDRKATYTYTSTSYDCEADPIPPEPRHHICRQTIMVRKPNGDLEVTFIRYSEQLHRTYECRQDFYDASENSISWVIYNPDGTVRSTGQVP